MVSASPDVKIRIDDLTVAYSDGTESLTGITMDIYVHQVNVLFGPSGGGKSTLLRTLNRLNDLADVATQRGRILVDGEDILDPDLDVIQLRRRLGIVFASPVPLPFSIYENVIYGLRLAGIRDRRCSMPPWSGHSSRPRFGTRLLIACPIAPTRSPAGSSSGSVSRGRWRLSPK